MAIRQKTGYLIILILQLLLWGNPLTAQERDTTGNSTILIDNSDNTIVEKEGDSYVKYLNGNVRIIHNGTFFYCDTAVIHNNDLLARGRVVILQKDTTTLFSDTLYYNGDSLKAQLSGRVLLFHQGKELKTQILEYDVKNKLAYYDTGGQLRQDSTILRSLECLYDINADRVYFKKFVTVEDSSFNLKADSIQYNTNKKIAYFTGPTLITQDSSQIYCEDGYYDIENKNAEFLKRAKYVENEKQASADRINYFDDKNTFLLSGKAKYRDKDQFVRADTIRYLRDEETSILTGHVFVESDESKVSGEYVVYHHDTGDFNSSGRSTLYEDEVIITADQMDFKEEEGKGYAHGNIIMQDTLSRTTIFSDHLISDDQEKSFTAYCDSLTRPLMEKIMDQDTMFLSADTLWSYEVAVENDSFQILNAFHDVRIFHANFQVVADSMSYHTKDSVFVFFYSPVLWTDSTQFSGDTISIYLENEQIHRLFLRFNGLIVDKQAGPLFNQIGGKTINVFFMNDSLRMMRIVGNAESLYYMTDENNRFMSAVKTVCSSMNFYFSQNEISDIKYYNEPISKMTPMKQEMNSPQRLKSFKWLIDQRPGDRNVRAKAIPKPGKNNIPDKNTEEPSGPDMEPPVPESGNTEDIPKPNIENDENKDD